MHRAAKWFGVAMLVVIFDQLTKAQIVRHLADGQSVVVTDFFRLMVVYNPGAAFSFLAGASGWQCAFFVVVALVAIAVISYLLLRHQRESLFCCALSLVLGGALGNVIDRVRWCAVVDFLLFHWHEYSFPAFNVADSFITIGAGLMIFDALRKSSHDK